MKKLKFEQFLNMDMYYEKYIHNNIVREIHYIIQEYMCRICIYSIVRYATLNISLK